MIFQLKHPRVLEMIHLDRQFRIITVLRGYGTGIYQNNIMFVDFIIIIIIYLSSLDYKDP